MADIKDTLKKLAEQIRDERNAGANTALRVGSLLLAMIDAGADVDKLRKIFGIKEQMDTITNRYNKWLYLFHISSC